MTTMNTFARTDVLPSWFINAQQQFISTLVANLALTQSSSTVLQVAATTSNGQVVIGIEGKWRYLTAIKTRAHPGGAAGTYDVYVTASANNIVNTPVTGTDNTVYSFELAITASGVPPTIVAGVVDHYRKIGECHWNGTAIDDVRQIVGQMGQTDVARPTSPNALTSPLRARMAAGQSADGFIVEDSTGTAVFRVTPAGALIASSTITATGGAISGAFTITTAAADTNTTQAASTAFVLGQASSVSPLMDGTVAVGTSLRYARADHVHPVDTSRAPLASPSLTGTPLAPTATLGTNTTQIATTAFVTAAVAAVTGGSGGVAFLGSIQTFTAAQTFSVGPVIPTAAVDTNTTQAASTAFVLAQSASATPLINGTAAVGTSTRFARGDHVHPTDTTRAPTASPTFTGTPISTTPVVDNNSTSIATTAYYMNQIGTANPVVNGTAGPGLSLRWSRQDHVHPTDTSRAATASPTFTGTVTLPSVTSTSTTLGFFGSTAISKPAGYGSGSQVVAGTKGALSAASTLNDVITNLSSLVADLRTIGLIGT